MVDNNKIIALINEAWKLKHSKFLVQEHFDEFINKLIFYSTNNFPDELPKPHFSEEITPLLKNKVTLIPKELTNENIANYIEKEPFENLLLIFGQRITPASVQDVNAIPPLEKELKNSCFKSYNSELSIACRSWEKHVGRTSDNFWGVIKGNVEEKEKQVKERIEFCLANKTWWNVFFHYKHELVYEIRVSEGNGLRWTADGKKFIGFVEPFI